MSEYNFENKKNIYFDESDKLFYKSYDKIGFFQVETTQGVHISFNGYNSPDTPENKLKSYNVTNFYNYTLIGTIRENETLRLNNEIKSVSHLLQTPNNFYIVFSDDTALDLKEENLDQFLKESFGISKNLKDINEANKKKKNKLK